MNNQVIYYSRKGNTKKIAEAIASELHIKAEFVKDAKLNENSFVFLGSGCYGSKPAKNIIAFIQNNAFHSRDVALFGTSGGGDGLEVKEMQKMLNDKNAHIKGTFFCKGKFLFANRGRPNEHDLSEVKQFAQEMKSSC